MDKSRLLKPVDNASRLSDNSIKSPQDGGILQSLQMELEKIRAVMESDSEEDEEGEDLRRFEIYGYFQKVKPTRNGIRWTSKIYFTIVLLFVRVMIFSISHKNPCDILYRNNFL